jgi:hypothetical protein
LPRVKLIEIALKVANDFQIRLGRYYIPELIKNSGEMQIEHFWSVLEDRLKSLSGRVLIDLQEKVGLIQFEHNHKASNDSSLIELSIKEIGIRFASDLVPLILDFCIKNNVDHIQLVDIDLTINSGTSNEDNICELVSEKIDENEKLDRSLLLFDVDGLIGVSESQTDSSESKSYSIQNQRLWQIILHTFKRSFNNTVNTNSKKWTVIVSSSKFIIEQFKSSVKFPLSNAEKDEIKEKTKERKCINCGSNYIESENNFSSCDYHCGALVTLSEKNNKTPISKENLLKIMGKFGSHEELEKFTKNYYYLCCMRSHNDTGCNKNKHSDQIQRTYDPTKIFLT